MEEPSAFKAFEQKAGVAFKDRTLVRVAFTHRSYLNESGHAAEHNERLEFLGDAVLELSVTGALYRAYPHASEGELTAYRAALVKSTTLSELAERLGINDCLLLSRGEAKDTGRARAAILANTFEAVIGALYLDQGFPAAVAFVEKHVMPRLEEVLREGSFRDAKSRFQELAQDKYGATPKYETVSAEGPDHAKHFIVELSVAGRLVARGEGDSKQEAEQSAAEAALESEEGGK